MQLFYFSVIEESGVKPHSKNKTGAAANQFQAPRPLHTGAERAPSGDYAYFFAGELAGEEPPLAAAADAAGVLPCLAAKGGSSPSSPAKK